MARKEQRKQGTAKKQQGNKKQGTTFSQQRKTQKDGLRSRKPKMVKIDEKPTFVEENTDFIFGKHAVRSALENNKKINKLFVQESLSSPDIRSILNIAKENKIHIQLVPKAKLNELTNDGVHQGVVLSMTPFEYAELDDLFEIANQKQEQPFFVILDGLEDPFNLGSILRTADATGVHGIIIPKRRTTLLTSTVAKASTGAIEHVPVVRVTNITQTIAELKQRGVWVFGTDMQGTDYRQWNTQGALAVVIGNEGKGISRLVKESVDELITIPMTGHVQSLNAGVASALLMYEVYRGRHGQ